MVAETYVDLFDADPQASSSTNAFTTVIAHVTNGAPTRAGFVDLIPSSMSDRSVVGKAIQDERQRRTVSAKQQVIMRGNSFG